MLCTFVLLCNSNYLAHCGLWESNDAETLCEDVVESILYSMYNGYPSLTTTTNSTSC
ncbi:hypothetical protein M378DRAFT_167612, partial [Amanita muscaria Koide BX008]